MPVLESVYIAKFVQWLMQCTPIMNNTIWVLSWNVTPILTPWKTLIPSTPNVINLDAILSCVRSPYKTKTSTRMHFKLFEVAPSTTCCNDNNKRFFCQPWTTYACIKTHDCWSQVVTSSQEREMNWTLWTKFLILFITTSCILVAISQLVLPDQCILG